MQKRCTSQSGFNIIFLISPCDKIGDSIFETLLQIKHYAWQQKSFLVLVLFYLIYLLTMSNGSSSRSGDPPVHSEDDNAGLRAVICQIMAEEQEAGSQRSLSIPTNQPS